jgi:hypothetical protein
MASPLQVAFYAALRCHEPEVKTRDHVARIGRNPFGGGPEGYAGVPSVIGVSREGHTPTRVVCSASISTYLVSARQDTGTDAGASQSKGDSRHRRVVALSFARERAPIRTGTWLCCALSRISNLTRAG